MEQQPEVQLTPETQPTPEAQPIAGEARTGQQIEAQQSAEKSPAPLDGPTHGSAPTQVADNQQVEEVLKESEEQFEELAKGPVEEARTWDAVLQIFRKLRSRLTKST